jgi:hypothetical protein
LTLASIVFLGALAMPVDSTIGRDPPCANLSLALEVPPMPSVCLDDWIRFNQKLWVDLFWPNNFTLSQPFILVDERLGFWTQGVGVTCLGISCAAPSGPGAIAVGAAGLTATGANLAKDLKDCTSNYTTALNTLAAETDLYQQLQCLIACVSTPPPPPPPP